METEPCEPNPERQDSGDNSLRVCYVAAYYDPAIAAGADVVDRTHTIREFAENVAKLGHKVDVVHLFHRNETFERGGVSYHFIRGGAFASTAAQAIARIRGGRSESDYLPGLRMLPVIRSLKPDVIHFFGLTLDLNLWLVSRTARRMHVPIIAQYHGGKPAPNRVRRFIQRRNIRRVDRFLFTTEWHARQWIDAGMPLDPKRVVPFMETSSVFRMKPRDEARAQTGITGDPVFLWTGRLHPEKDPLVALRGFERIRQCWPQAQFYFYYLTDELLPELRAFVDRRPELADAVQFRGRTPFEQMEDIYNSADFFIQASHRETSGFAPLEAMACGVIPVLTDIPAFRAMTGDGHYGVHFPIGDVEKLVQGVLAIDREQIPQLSREVQAHWERELSFPALARQLDQAYRSVIHGGQF